MCLDAYGLQSWFLELWATNEIVKYKDIENETII